MKISKYLIRRIDPRIPDYIYSAFPSIASDTEMLHKVYKAYKLGIDSDYALAYFSMNSTGIIITKLSTYRIDPERKIIIAVFNLVLKHMKKIIEGILMFKQYAKNIKIVWIICLLTNILLLGRLNVSKII